MTVFDNVTSTRPGVIAIAVGAVPTLIGVIWAFFVGFYPSQLPVILVLLAVGLGLLGAGQKMYQNAQRTIALQRISERDAAAEDGR